jgi:esterase/lipase superfamily enzyme
MKKIIFVLVLGFLASCESFKFKNDQHFEKNIGNLWSGYFQQNFDSTKNVEVFVATNRKGKNENFNCGQSSFGVSLAAKTSFGLCQINVPKNHVVGEILLAQNNTDSANNFFKVLDEKTLQQKDFLTELKKSPRTPLVFVHGFNVRFQEAVLRAAQIAYDLKYQGPIVLFTWPAGSNDGFFEEKMLNKTYENNLKNAHASVEAFKNFLLSLQKEKIKINLLVHSMGHQVVLPALKDLGEKQKSEVFINQIILNAPDFEAAQFKNFIKKIKKVSNRITLYCSYNDKAMLASKTFNKNERLGACASFDGLDTINVGLTDDTVLGLGHGYYSSRAVLNDVFQTLIGIDASNRLFVIKSEPNGAEKYFLRN